MIEGLKPYPAYKDSGQPWLGDVPEHWGLESLGSITTAISRRGRPDLPLLSVVREKGVIARSTMSDEENHNYVPDDLSNYKFVRKGDLVINKMKAWQGSLGVAPMDGVVSPAYFVFHLQIDDLRFGQALLRSRPYVGFFAQLSDGVRIGQWDLSIQGMKRIPVVVPPSAEQSAIVRFLDGADRRIRRYILAKKKLIKLLEEQKQAIIHRAVTRGLDPNVSLKPSGVGWLGSIPAHWRVGRLKDCLRAPLAYGVLKPDKYEGPDAIPLIRILDVSGGVIRQEQLERISPSQDAEFARTRVRPGDVIVSVVGTIGRSAVVTESLGCANLSRALCRVQVSAAVSAEYLHVYCQSRVFLEQADSIPAGTAQRVLNLGDLKRFDIAIPPPNEQADIVSWLSVATKPQLAGADNARREIALIGQYRSRLIADVVTGKLDVREAAASLPDETEELEPVDADALVEENVEADDGEVAAASEGVEE